MVLAFELSARLGLCPQTDAQRARRALAAAGLPTALAGLGGRHWDADRLIEHMRQDKKVRDGALTFVLARGIGKSFVAHDVSADVVRPLLKAALAA
jgi:3-dehydroquinate synthase